MNFIVTSAVIARNFSEAVIITVTAKKIQHDKLVCVSVTMNVIITAN